MVKKDDSTLVFAKEIAEAAGKIKAVDLKILDLTKLSTFADYFIIASGNSDRQVEAIADSIIIEMKKKGRTPIGTEGFDHSQWIIVDYGEVVAHIFYHPIREIYSIEKLWADAKVIKVKSKNEKVKTKSKKGKPAKKVKKAKAKK